VNFPLAGGPRIGYKDTTTI